MPARAALRCEAVCWRGRRARPGRRDDTHAIRREIAGYFALEPRATGRFREPGDNSAIGRLHLCFRLLQLLRVEVQSFLFQGDRLPGQVAAHCLVQILQPGVIDRQERQRVPEQSRRCTA